MNLHPLNLHHSRASRLSSGSLRFVTRHTALSIALGAAGGAALLGLAGGVAIGMHWGGGAPPADPPKPIERDYTIDRLAALSASVAQFGPRIARLTTQLDELQDFEARLDTPRRAPRAVVEGGPAGGSAGALAGASAGASSAASSRVSGRGATPADAAGGPALPPRGCGAAQGRDERVAQHALDARAERDARAPRNARPAQAVQVAQNARVARDDPHTQADATGRELACLAATLGALEREAADHEAAYAAFPGRMPASARFGSPFGNRSDPFTRRLSFHPGVDLVAAAGTPIVAAAGGRVVFAGEKSGYGNAVEVDHGNGLITRYGHASRVVVRAGDLVLPRQHIADVGSTGRSTGPHLHFEVLINGAPVDPAAYLAVFAAAEHQRG